jgi:hypothetical protein
MQQKAWSRAGVQVAGVWDESGRRLDLDLVALVCNACAISIHVDWKGPWGLSRASAQQESARSLRVIASGGLCSGLSGHEWSFADRGPPLAATAAHWALQLLNGRT